VLGAIHAATGRAAWAERSFACSLDLLEAVGDVLEAARTQCVWGRWLKRQGDDRAGALLDAASRTFERCGATIDLMQMERS
jgi:hypothetical protein